MPEVAAEPVAETQNEKIGYTDSGFSFERVGDTLTFRFPNGNTLEYPKSNIESVQISTAGQCFVVMRGVTTPLGGGKNSYSGWKTVIREDGETPYDAKDSSNIYPNPEHTTTIYETPMPSYPWTKVGEPEEVKMFTKRKS